VVDSFLTPGETLDWSCGYQCRA